MIATMQLCKNIINTWEKQYQVFSNKYSRVGTEVHVLQSLGIATASLT